MYLKNEINIEEVTKTEIINLLKNKSACYFGDIIKELKLSNTKALKYIMELKKEGIIQRDSNPPLYRLINF